ncbi:hopanoid biosynthesis-associated protein HpnK [Roseococcus microcysteis]|uniref:hopanoid biosynthesis-associated protein HpnK n=1 Tax=Roseococcus microcysteis TaxID=2771361 RepID=UPI00168A7315|nr:hopanoid biosynthesis-associated protein HpnK [Roseococcus microcysteis]
MTRRLIFNADDLGLHAAVNEGIERAHREGVLTAASLMVGEPGFEEGVRIARANPGLAVGLHVTLTDGRPVLPPSHIPSLTQPNGLFRDDMERLGARIATSRAAQAELAAEVAAQMARFRETGLPCDHVNAHKHFHNHPWIAGAMIRIAAEAGVRAIRVPWEPQRLVRAAEAASGEGRGDDVGEWALRPAGWVLRARAARRGLRAPDIMVGHAWSGHFTPARLRAVLPLLPEGVTELYFHPAARDGFGRGGPGYRHEAELAALTDPAVIEAVAALPRGGYTPMLFP